MKQGDVSSAQTRCFICKQSAVDQCQINCLFISSLINFLISSSQFDSNIFFSFENEFFSLRNHKAHCQDEHLHWKEKMRDEYCLQPASTGCRNAALAVGRYTSMIFSPSFSVTSTKEWIRLVGRISFSCHCSLEGPHQHLGKARAETYHAPVCPRAIAVCCSNALLGNFIRIRQKRLQKHISASDSWLLGNDSLGDNHDRQPFNKDWHFSWK